MVGEGPAASRPRVPAGLIVDVDDELTHDHSVCKGNDAPVTFEFTIYHEPRHQTFMNSANIADRVPNKFFVSISISLWIVATGLHSDLWLIQDSTIANAQQSNRAAGFDVIFVALKLDSV
jgi:hypothetical protein